MRHIHNIDDFLKNPSKTITHISTSRIKWVIAKPLEGSGLFKWKVRIIKAYAVLIGKADAFTYTKPKP